MVQPEALEWHAALGIPDDYATTRGLPAYDEAVELVDVGPNLVGRMQRLTPAAAERWAKLVAAAATDDIRLMIVSGFRSFAYQAELIRKKLDAGQAIEAILEVSAAPGYSEHHTGRAVDIASPGSRPLTEEFAGSEAYAWLAGQAGEFGFTLTYPRDNRYGMAYEPWHWALTE